MAGSHQLLLAGGAGLPGAPTSVVGTASSQSAISVAFSPTTDGGAAITSYTVTASPGGATATGASSPITVSGLSASTEYTFTVRATNIVGDSPESSPSAGVYTFFASGSQTYNTANYAGTTIQPTGYPTVTLELWGSGAETNRPSGAGSYISASNVPVSGLNLYLPSAYRSGNTTLGGYNGGNFGPASVTPYRGGYGGSGTVAISGGTTYVAGGGGGGNGRSNGTFTTDEGGPYTNVNQPPSGTNGGNGAAGGCYYGGGGGGGGSTGGYGGDRNYGGAAGVSLNYTSRSLNGGAGRGVAGYARISWS